jgi:hypothetical protein
MGYTIGNATHEGSEPENLLVTRNGVAKQMLFPGQSPFFGIAAAGGGTISGNNEVGINQYMFGNTPSFRVDCSMLLTKDKDS